MKFQQRVPATAVEPAVEFEGKLEDVMALPCVVAFTQMKDFQRFSFSGRLNGSLLWRGALVAEYEDGTWKIVGNMSHTPKGIPSFGRIMETTEGTMAIKKVRLSDAERAVIEARMNRKVYFAKIDGVV